MIGYKYFISFVAKAKDREGVSHGNAIIGVRNRLEDMESIEDVKEIQKAICEENDLEGVAITNFIFLREDINDDILEKACEAVVNAENDGDHIPHID